MRFHYIASQVNGKVVEGETDSQSLAEVLGLLASKGLKPVSVRRQDSFSVKKNVFFQGSLNLTDKIFLTKYLALMLKIGTDLFNSIDILIADFDKEAMRSLLYEIRSNLEKGLPFYTTFAKYPKHFSPVFVNLIKAGEASGTLDVVFERLSQTLKREQDLKGQIRAALVYPMILTFAASGIVFFLLGFALPKIAKVFTDSGFEPPLFSKIVFAIGLFFNAHLFLISGLSIGILVAGVILFLRSMTVKRVVQRFLRKSPLVGEVMKKIALQRFALTFASLLSSGLPILESMDITAEAVGFEELREALLRISHEGIARGLTVGEAFKKEPIFPRMVVNLISVSERAGHIEQILFTLAEFYESEIKSSVKTLISFLEPILLLALGLIIGTIAVSMIVPIYQLVGSFGQAQ